MNDNHGAKKMRLGLVVKLILDVRVANKDKRALLKILILDGRGETLDKFCHGLFPGLQDSG